MAKVVLTNDGSFILQRIIYKLTNLEHNSEIEKEKWTSFDTVIIKIYWNSIIVLDSNNRSGLGTKNFEG